MYNCYVHLGLGSKICSWSDIYTNTNVEIMIQKSRENVHSKDNVRNISSNIITLLYTQQFSSEK